MSRNFTISVDVWKRTVCVKVVTWHVQWNGIYPNPICVDICNLFSRLPMSIDAYLTSRHDISTSLKLGCLFVVQLHCCLDPKHGMLASTFKVLIGSTGYLIGQAWRNKSSRKSSLVTNMRTRTLPSQNACRVKEDGMGSTYQRRFALLVFHSMFNP